jgi:hypothetical protein
LTPWYPPAILRFDDYSRKFDDVRLRLDDDYDYRPYDR